MVLLSESQCPLLQIGDDKVYPQSVAERIEFMGKRAAHLVHSKHSLNGCAVMKVSTEASPGLCVLASVCTTCARLLPRTKIASSASLALGGP